MKRSILFPTFFSLVALLVFSFFPKAAWAAAPTAPTNLIAAVISSRQLNLSWQDNATREANYYVESAPASKGTWKVVATLGANVTSYQNTGLTQNTAYYYRIRCKAGKTYSTYSNTANATTAALVAPTGLTAGVTSTSSISLAWTDNTAYESSYSVERSPNGSKSWTVIATLGANATTYTNTGLTVGTAYYYRVRAYDGTSYSAYSTIVSQTIRTITASAGANGAISPSGTVGVANGSSQVFTLTPNSGYKIATVTVDGSAVATNPTYTFSNLTANHTISVMFSEMNIFAITASAGANGSISPSGSVVVNSGAIQTFEITATPGYHIADVLVDGASVGAVGAYKFINVTANHNIAASFAPDDTTPPTGSIVINDGAVATNDRAVILTLNATDSQSGVSQMQFRNENENWSAAEDYATMKSWTLTAVDGQKKVYVNFRDTAGNWSTDIPPCSIMLDTVPPVTSATPPAGLYNSAQNVTLMSSESATIYYTTNDVTPTTASLVYSGMISIPTDTTTTLKFFAKDSAGNNEAVTSATYIIDTQPPTLKLSTLDDGSYTNKAILNITGTVADNIGIQGLSINGTALTVNGDGTFSQVITLLTNANTITSVAIDLAGNTTTDVRIITLDLTAPAITLTNPADSSVTNAMDVTVMGSVDETSTVSVSVKLNNDNPIPAIVTDDTFSVPLTLVYDQNTIEVMAVDQANNTATVKRTVTFDNVSPSLSVTSPAQDMSTNQSTTALQGTVSDLTTPTITIMIDGTISTPTVTAGIFQQELAFNTQKTYAVIVTATDAAGNQTMVQRNIIYDTTPPVVVINPLTTPTDQSSQAISGTMETASFVSITCQTATVGPVSYPTATTWQASLTDMTEGVNTFYMTTTDQAGNASVSLNATITLDSIAPITSATPAGGVYAAGLFISLTTSETATIYYTSDGSTPTIASMVYTGPVAIAATSTLRYFAVDQAGNSEGVKTAEYTIDPALPLETTLSSNPSSPDGENGWYKTVPTLVLTRNKPGTTYYKWGSELTGYDVSRQNRAWIDSGDPLNICADNVGAWYTLPFNFPFYGTNCSSVFLSSNGLISLNAPDVSFDNSAQALATKTAIAPLWDDLRTDYGDVCDIYVFQPDENSIVFRWLAVTNNSYNAYTFFEAILYRDGSIRFNYETQKGGLSPTIGISKGDKVNYQIVYDNNITSTYNMSSIVFAPNGWSVYSGPINAPEREDALYYYSVNGAGYAEEVKSGTFKVDATMPDGYFFISSRMPNTNYTNSFAATLALTCADTESGCSRMQFSYDNTTWSTPEPYATTKNWTLSPGDGPKTIYAKFQDTAGNWSPAHLSSIILDTNPPYKPGTPGFVKIAAGGYVSSGIMDDGTLWVWGSSLESEDYLSRVRINNESDWRDVAAGLWSSFALKTDNTLWARGFNYYGTLGDGTNDERYPLVRVGTDRDWKSVSTSGYHTLALKQDGTLWAWGANWYGQLGDGNTEDKWAPVQITSDHDWVAIKAGSLHSFALKSDGTLWAWGNNSHGQLGIGTFDEVKAVPTQVGTDHDWVHFSTGSGRGWYAGSYAIKSDGTLWAWGYNDDGELGTGMVGDVSTPVQIGADHDWKEINIGENYSIGLKSTGTLWTWGNNNWNWMFSPIRIGVNTNWTSISAGEFNALALRSDEGLWTWGQDCWDQLFWRTNPIYVYGSNKLPLINNFDNYTNNQTALLSFNIADDTSGVAYMQLSNDGTSWSETEQYYFWQTTKYWTLSPGDGLKHVYVRFQDAAGNWTDAHSSSIIFDATAPMGTVKINNGDSITNLTVVLLTLACSDEMSGCAWMQFSNDGGTWSSPETYATSKSWLLWPVNDGLRTVFVRFLDAAGNSSAVTTASIMLDRTPPSLNIMSPVPGYTGNNRPLLEYTANEGIVVVKVDGLVVDKVSGNLLDALSDGIHIVRVEATDAAGNTGSTEVAFTVDTVAPTVSITSPSASMESNNTPTLMYSVSDGTVVVKADGVVVSKVSGDALNPLTEGSHTVLVEATDVAGNTGSAQVSFTIVILPPVVSIYSPFAGTTNNSTPVLTYTISDGTVVVKVDGVVVDKIFGSTLDTLVAGGHTVRVEATNIAGKTGSAEVTFIVLVDAIPGGCGDPDESNVFCNGSTKYLVGPSSFTNGIPVPTSGNAVLIASPTNFSTINGPRTIIKGAMDTTVPVNTVSVLVTNGTGSTSYLAQVNGKYFAAQVLVPAGDNVITVTATDQDSEKHQASINVAGIAQTNTVTLQASPNTGIPTLKENGKTLLDVALITTATLTTGVANYEWDFSGTGSSDLTCYSHSNVDLSYEHVGLYLTTVKVANTAGDRYKDTAIVNVVDANEMNSAFTTIWSRMKTALLAGDISATLTDYSENTKSHYQQIFTELINTNSVDPIYKNITDIVVGNIDNQIAECWALRPENDGMHAYPITFVKDENGIWKIMGY